jgi:hypothetical protein
MRKSSSRKSLNLRPPAWPKKVTTKVSPLATRAFTTKELFGVSKLHRWKQELDQDGEGAFPSKDTPRDEKMAQLRRMLCLLEEENAILKCEARIAMPRFA